MESEQPDFVTAENAYNAEHRDLPVDLPFDRSTKSHEVAIPLGSFEDNSQQLEQPDLDKNQQLHRSEGFSYITDESGHLAENANLDYREEFYREREAETAPENEEEEKAAVGQLAVGTSGSVDVPADDNPASTSDNPLRQFVSHITSTLRDSQQLLGSNSSIAVDALLWGIVVIIYIAIIAALRS
jgi:hypothetical protein